jgi:ADP-ribosylglycohydrolase
MRLTWVQPEDLVGHALRQAELDGIDVAGQTARWVAAGGDPTPLRGGASTLAGGASSAQQRVVAGELLDELDELISPYDADEPTDLDAIRAARVDLDVLTKITGDTSGMPPQNVKINAEVGSSRVIDAGGVFERVHGAWLGRAAGCLLGKPVEKIPRAGIREILQAQGRWPLGDWFTADGLPEDVAARWPWNRRSATTSLKETFAGGLGMPEDDDLNYPMLNLALLEDHGDALTSDDVAERWLAELPAGRVFTAERIAYRNLLLGHLPPATARVRNPFRDWIGAQIRGDVFGWAQPGDPLAAADLAWRDAIVSHTRNGVYGEMFVAAACSAAVAGAPLDSVLDAGLSVVPAKSRYAETVRFARELRHRHDDWEFAVDAIDVRHGDEHWVHVLGNAALTVAALTFGDGDLERSICLVVSGGRDTDSNGATVGSIAGALAGAAQLPSRWIAPLRNRVATTLGGFDGIGFDELARRTVAVADRMAAVRA